MRYVEHSGYIEHIPESDFDVKHLKEHYGAIEPFMSWCTAKQLPQLKIDFKLGVFIQIWGNEVAIANRNPL